MVLLVVVLVGRLAPHAWGAALALLTGAVLLSCASRTWRHRTVASSGRTQAAPAGNLGPIMGISLNLGVRRSRPPAGKEAGGLAVDVASGRHCLQRGPGVEVSAQPAPPQHSIPADSSAATAAAAGAGSGGSPRGEPSSPKPARLLLRQMKPRQVRDIIAFATSPTPAPQFDPTAFRAQRSPAALRSSSLQQLRRSAPAPELLCRRSSTGGSGRRLNTSSSRSSAGSMSSTTSGDRAFNKRARRRCAAVGSSLLCASDATVQSPAAVELTPASSAPPPPPPTPMPDADAASPSPWYDARHARHTPLQPASRPRACLVGCYGGGRARGGARGNRGRGRLRGGGGAEQRLLQRQ